MEKSCSSFGVLKSVKDEDDDLVCDFEAVTETIVKEEYNVQAPVEVSEDNASNLNRVISDLEESISQYVKLVDAKESLGSSICTTLKSVKYFCIF